MTKTEQLQAAWHTLQCSSLIKEMLLEVKAKSDEIEFAQNRFKTIGDQFLMEERKQKISAIAQQMQLLNVTPEELAEFIEKSKTITRRPKKEAMHVATIDGVMVHKGLPLPAIMAEKGWNRINKIPEEYWTEEYRAFRSA